MAKKMNDIEQEKLVKVVLNKVVDDKTVSAILKEDGFHDVMQGNKYDFDVTVRLTGQIKQFFDHEGEISNRVKWQQMFICLLEEYQKVCLAAKVTGVNLKTLAKNAAKLEEELPELAKEKTEAIVEEIKESTVGIIRGQVRCNVVAETLKVETAFAGEVEKKK